MDVDVLLSMMRGKEAPAKIHLRLPWTLSKTAVNVFVIYLYTTLQNKVSLSNITLMNNDYLLLLCGV